MELTTELSLDEWPARVLKEQVSERVWPALPVPSQAQGCSAVMDGWCYLLMGSAGPRVTQLLVLNLDDDGI